MAVETRDMKRERRRAVRQKCKVRIEMIVRYKYGASGEWTENAVEIKGKLLDLSADGAMLYTKDSFVIDQELRLTIFIPKQPPVTTPVTVRSSKLIPEKECYASGTKFRGIPAEGLAGIVRFLNGVGENAA